MAQANSINNKASQLTIDPGASGDSFIQCDINATGEWRLGVDDTDDSFTLSQGSALGTNNAFNIDSNGIVLTPLQPLAINNINAEANVTGDGTDHSVGSVVATTSVVDQNADMTDGDGAGTGATFTAPVTGLYGLSLSMVWGNSAADVVSSIGFIVTSNRTYRIYNLPYRGAVANFFAANGFLAGSGVIIADMDAADTAIFHIQDSGGTKFTTLHNFFLGAVLLV